MRAILRSYTQCKILHKTATGTARGGQDYVDLWAVGKKLDALERLLILKGVSTGVWDTKGRGGGGEVERGASGDGRRYSRRLGTLWTPRRRDARLGVGLRRSYECSASSQSRYLAALVRPCETDLSLFTPRLPPSFPSYVPSMQFTSLSLQILQTRSHFSLPLTDPKLPSSQNPSLVNPNPSSASPSSQRSIPYSNSSGLDAARIQIFPNGPPMRVSRALPRGAGASETRGTMEGVDVDRAGVVRESVPAAGEGAEGGGDVLPQYERLGDGVAVGEDEDVPGYVRGTGEVPGYV